jgi:hypothetical protein
MESKRKSAMTKKSSREAEPTGKPIDLVISPLDEEQTREFLEIMHNPPPPNDALKALMKPTPHWRERTQIEDVFGMLEREGQRTVSIEEMNEAVAEQAAEDDERIKKG